MGLRIFKVLLVLPAFIMAPLGWMILAGGGSREALAAIVYFVVSSAIGLASLAIALFCDLRSLQGRPRWLLAGGLIIGIQLAVYCFSRGLPRHADAGLAAIWLVGGPLLVAIGCAYGLISPREQPNKAPEPTPGSVTPHADA